MAWYSNLVSVFRKRSRIGTVSEPALKSGQQHTAPTPDLSLSVLQLPVDEHWPIDLVVNGVHDGAPVSLRWSRRTGEIYLTSRATDDPISVLGRSSLARASELTDGLLFPSPLGGPDRQLEALEAALKAEDK